MLPLQCVALIVVASSPYSTCLQYLITSIGKVYGPVVHKNRAISLVLCSLYVVNTLRQTIATLASLIKYSCIQCTSFVLIIYIEYGVLAVSIYEWGKITFSI